MLTQRSVITYLSERSLISSGSIVDGDLAVADVSRRNINFQISSESGCSYLVKQGGWPDGAKTVAHEAFVYEHLRSQVRGEGMGPYLPDFHGYDPKEGILLLGLLRDARTLKEHYRRAGRFSRRLAATIGKALGTLHKVKWSDVAPAPPWILSLHRPDLEALRDLSSANVEIIKILQSYAGFCAQLDQLRRDWTSGTLIHFDMKWENCLVVAGSAGSSRTAVKIIDWELAGSGDACWDVGSIFSEYLSFWLRSIPISGEAPPEHFAALARYPLGKMRPALCAFWKSYSREMNLGAAESDLWLSRAARFGAARLLQTALEQMQTSVRLTGDIVCLLQVSSNILQRPREAIVQLLGIPLHAEFPRELIPRAD